MTPERIEEIRKLLQGSSPTPWVADSEASVYDATGRLIMPYLQQPNAVLIAAAPTVIAELLAEVERLRTEISDWVKLADAQDDLLAFYRDKVNATT